MTPATPIEIGGVPLLLLADRAVLSERSRTLFIADLHIGKDDALRAGGMAVPPGTTADDLARLSALLDDTGAGRLIVLGDFLHAVASRQPESRSQLQRWRETHADVDLLLVRGNHDRSAGDPWPELGIGVVDEPHPDGGLLLAHDPARPAPPDAPPRLAGHLHPKVRLGPGLTPPAFWWRAATRTLVLPAFSRFTAGARIRPAPGDRAWSALEGGPPEPLLGG